MPNSHEVQLNSAGSSIYGATLEAVIFDLDGVVADSHPIHEAAWKTLLVEQGIDSASLNVDFLYAGHPRREILRHYLGSIKPSEMERLGRRKDYLYAIAANKLHAKPGIPRVLSQLNADRILCALATSAGRVRAHESLERRIHAVAHPSVVGPNDQVHGTAGVGTHRRLRLTARRGRPDERPRPPGRRHRPLRDRDRPGTRPTGAG